MRTFHHIGLVTKTEKPGEAWFDSLKVWGTNPDDDPNKVEWVRFTPESPLAGTAVAQGPHVSYVVENLDAALRGITPVAGPLQALPNVRIAYFWENGVLIEYMEVK